ncbi:STAS domain-containing protein [Saprospira sp. CCB-QB6]|uniref:STAS domain-containing protein n=1 Tax=Saprospira sp. CCB-QB6 TaxID=3023936 RepID=UPI00234926D5|nr:STAS domain-containing protein [Saprospira sp. CCB-QB6]WCL81503.1 STAS domain-containing protein [Saprospira sp. CCB-QB6]
MQKVKTAALYRRQFFIDQSDLDLIAAAGKQVPAEVEGQVFERLFDWMRNCPEYGEYYTEDLIAGIDQGNSIIWSDMISGVLDEAYVERHLGFGDAFLGLGLSLNAFMSLLAACQEFVLEELIKYAGKDADFILAFKKYAQVGLDIVSEVYRKRSLKSLEDQNDALRELSTPVAQIWEDILLLPLVGFIDSKRAKDVMEAMLDKIAETQAKFFILDISGVAIVDTAVANHLIKMSKAARLMGTQCMISGVSGPIAQTIVELGISIDEIRTTGSMRDALGLAIKEAGVAF